MPLIAVPRTMPFACQKCWRNIICQRCSIRRRVLADDQLRDVLDRADDGARVPLERRLAPAVQPGLVGDDLDEDPVAHPGMADVRLDGGDLHETPRRSATLSSMTRSTSPRSTFELVIP